MSNELSIASQLFVQFRVIRACHIFRFGQIAVATDDWLQKNDPFFLKVDGLVLAQKKLGCFLQPEKPFCVQKDWDISKECGVHSPEYLSESIRLNWQGTRHSGLQLKNMTFFRVYMKRSRYCHVTIPFQNCNFTVAEKVQFS